MMDDLQKAREKLRQHKARLALYKYLHAAMWEGSDVPAPPICGGEHITEQLHDLLGIKKPWWQRIFGR